MDKKAAIAALGALAQETRLDLFRLLVTIGPEGLPAGVIADRLGVLPASLSFHLQQLVQLAYLTENCCGQGAAVCAPVCNPAVSCGITKPDTTAA
jgi:hypothetical protein